MLKKHNQLFLTLLIVFDAISTAGAWVLATYVWLYADFARIINPVIGMEYKGGFTPSVYWVAMPITVLVSLFCYNHYNLYKPRRSDRLINEIFDIIKSTVTAVVLLMAISFFVKEVTFSRGVTIFFMAFSTVFMAVSRGVIRSILRAMRRKGLNLRHVVVVGTGELAQIFAEKVKTNPWAGMNVVGFVTIGSEPAGTAIGSFQVAGSVNDLPQILQKHNVDQIFLALPYEEHTKLKEVMNLLTDEFVDINIVPDLMEFETLNTNVSDFDGLPIISLRESPLYGWNSIMKRIFDIAFSLFAITLTLPAMLAIAALVKLTSKGPVFYKQARMGLNGKTFQMLKFRTMKTDAEKETGPVWAAKDDPRRTKIGTFLRATSLDELPQFFNVITGEMSVVGPRPERPELIEEFKKFVPKYMLRHKMKSGITGWAQVNGWRGNTSLEKRIQSDIYYIENWSLWFDVRIIFMTLFSIRKNAY